MIGSPYTSYLANIFKSKIIVHYYQPLVPPPKALVDLLNVRRMIKTLPRISFDFIYCPYELFEWIFASVILKNKLKIPLVTSINLFEPHEISTFPFYMLRYKTFFRNLFLKKSDLIFCVSSEIKNSLIKLGIDKRRLFVVGSGVDIDKIKSVSSQEKIYDACFVGDLIPRKGITDLIYVWKHVTRKFNDCKLIIIGKAWNEKYQYRIKSLVKRNNLQNNILFTGFVIGEEEKYKLIKRSKIFIFPSYSEGFGIAVCEALACGLPVVAYELPALKEHFGDCIKYVAKGDINSMATIAINLLTNDNNRFDAESRGMEIAQRYDWENLSKRMLDVITHLII